MTGGHTSDSLAWSLWLDRNKDVGTCVSVRVMRAMCKHACASVPGASGGLGVLCGAAVPREVSPVTSFHIRCEIRIWRMEGAHSNFRGKLWSRYAPVTQFPW